MGYTVYDADKWVKYLYYKKEFLQVIHQNFPQVFSEDGKFNKRKLRNLVFNNKQELKRLESLVHPFLKRKLLSVIRRQANRETLVFLDVALLFEMNWDKYCQNIILANVDKNIQKQRVMKRDNISAEDFEKILSAQMDNEEKKKYVDFVVNTGNSRGKIKSQLIKILDELNK